jgi:hypothetical protein
VPAQAGISTPSGDSTPESMDSAQVCQLREDVISRYVFHGQNASISSRGWKETMKWVLSSPAPARAPERAAPPSSPRSPYPALALSSPTVGSNLVAGFDRPGSLPPPGKRAFAPRRLSVGDSPVSVRSSFQYPEAHPAAPAAQAKPRADPPAAPPRSPRSPARREKRPGAHPPSPAPRRAGGGSPPSPCGGKAPASAPASPAAAPPRRPRRRFPLAEHLCQVAAADNGLDVPKRALPASAASLFPEG